jgi:hypothetical protein
VVSACKLLMLCPLTIKAPLKIERGMVVVEEIGRDSGAIELEASNYNKNKVWVKTILECCSHMQNMCVNPASFTTSCTRVHIRDYDRISVNSCTTTTSPFCWGFAPN